MVNPLASQSEGPGFKTPGHDPSRLCIQVLFHYYFGLAETLLGLYHIRIQESQLPSHSALVPGLGVVAEAEKT